MTHSGRYDGARSALEEHKAARRLTKISKANPSFPTETYWMIPGSPHTLALNGGLHFALWSLDRPSGAVRPT